MNALKLFAFITVIQFLNCATALNILAIVTLPLKSHYVAFERFFRELANRGHSVTVMNNYNEKSPPPNMTFVDLSRDRYPGTKMRPMSAYEGANAHYMRMINIYHHFLARSQHVGQDCEHLVTSKEVVDFLAKKQKFDVIIVEQFMSDCGAAFAAALYDAPIIGITSHTLLPWSYWRLGIPFDFSSDAFYFSTGGKNPSLYHKIEAYLTNLWMQHVLEPQIFRRIDEIFKRHVPEFRGNVKEDVLEKMVMMFVYQHFSVTGARLLSPQVLEIGGLHINEAKPIPKDMEKFLATATHGAIYVSFGSNLNASTMSPMKKQAFLDTFKKIPQKVLWKIDNESIGTNENIYTRSWFPQRDVLCHPKVLAFVSHGGMLSLSEAAHCGKPLLTIPFFGDQYSNSAAVEQAGFGMTLYLDDVNADSLSAAMKYLTSKKMQESARNIQNLWNDRPMNVLDSAIYWTEYIARHRAAPSLPSKQSSWFQCSLIDVYSVLITIAILLILILLGILSLIKALIKVCFIRNFKRKSD